MVLNPFPPNMNDQKLVGSNTFLLIQILGSGKKIIGKKLAKKERVPEVESLKPL
jgi:hypothetical protein